MADRQAVQQNSQQAVDTEDDADEYLEDILSKLDDDDVDWDDSLTQDATLVESNNSNYQQSAVDDDDEIGEELLADSTSDNWFDLLVDEDYSPYDDEKDRNISSIVKNIRPDGVVAKKPVNDIKSKRQAAERTSPTEDNIVFLQDNEEKRSRIQATETNQPVKNTDFDVAPIDNIADSLSDDINEITSLIENQPDNTDDLESAIDSPSLQITPPTIKSESLEIRADAGAKNLSLSKDSAALIKQSTESALPKKQQSALNTISADSSSTIDDAPSAGQIGANVPTMQVDSARTDTGATKRADNTEIGNLHTDSLEDQTIDDSVDLNFNSEFNKALQDKRSIDPSAETNVFLEEEDELSSAGAFDPEQTIDDSINFEYHKDVKTDNVPSLNADSGDVDIAESFDTIFADEGAAQQEIDVPLAVSIESLPSDDPVMPGNIVANDANKSNASVKVAPKKRKKARIQKDLPLPMNNTVITSVSVIGGVIAIMLVGMLIYMNLLFVNIDTRVMRLSERQEKIMKVMRYREDNPLSEDLAGSLATRMDDMEAVVKHLGSSAQTNLASNQQILHKANEQGRHLVALVKTVSELKTEFTNKQLATDRYAKETAMKLYETEAIITATKNTASLAKENAAKALALMGEQATKVQMTEAKVAEALAVAEKSSLKAQKAEDNAEKMRAATAQRMADARAARAREMTNKSTRQGPTPQPAVTHQAIEPTTHTQAASDNSTQTPTPSVGNTRKRRQLNTAKRGWAVNLASFNRELTYQKVATQLQQNGIEAEQVVVHVKGKKWYRIRVTGFQSMQEATTYANEIKGKYGLMDPWVGR